MQINKIFISLLLCFTCGIAQSASAASFCTTSADGKIRMDDCNYNSYEECKKATGKQGNCVSNQDAKALAEKVAPYCIVTWGTECSYYDYDLCVQTAKKQIGYCYMNPDFENDKK